MGEAAAMANEKHLELLQKEPSVEPDLNLANLEGADLRKANLQSAQLDTAILCKALLQGADLRYANLFGAKLMGARLQGANLRFANLLEVDLSDADLTGAFVYGASVWNLILERTTQRDLVITEFNQPEVTVDNIEVAQFLYLLLRNKKMRSVIDTITSKVVLILGRFTPERKPILDALRDERRKPGRNYVPVMFDFEKPGSQTTVETVTLLARMARFVIADLTDAKSVLQELQAIVPNSPKLAVQPLIIAAQEEPGMFDFLGSFPWALKTHRYNNPTELEAALDERVIRPAEAKVLELRGPG
jgi:hypothetical protein